ncbi:hypothetical protein JI59_21845 (plasmid) [Novosphingobium pentaromativorans US6-1]|nr:hypothetical protein JI59_21845 [Novosphingobium pentaromativorans US6-1]
MMSANAIEKAFWTALSDPGQLERYRSDSKAYLESFNIDSGERAEIEAWDVAEIAARGVNPLLLLSFFSAVKSPRDLPEYLQKINTPPRNAA